MKQVSNGMVQDANKTQNTYQNVIQKPDAGLMAQKPSTDLNSQQQKSPISNAADKLAATAWGLVPAADRAVRVVSGKPLPMYSEYKAVFGNQQPMSGQNLIDMTKSTFPIVSQGLGFIEGAKAGSASKAIQGALTGNTTDYNPLDGLKKIVTAKNAGDVLAGVSGTVMPVITGLMPHLFGNYIGPDHGKEGQPAPTTIADKAAQLHDRLYETDLPPGVSDQIMVNYLSDLRKEAKANNELSLFDDLQAKVVSGLIKGKMAFDKWMGSPSFTKETSRSVEDVAEKLPDVERYLPAEYKPIRAAVQTPRSKATLDMELESNLSPEALTQRAGWNHNLFRPIVNGRTYTGVNPIPHGAEVKFVPKAFGGGGNVSVWHLVPGESVVVNPRTSAWIIVIPHSLRGAVSIRPMVANEMETFTASVRTTIIECGHSEACGENEFHELLTPEVSPQEKVTEKGIEKESANWRWDPENKSLTWIGERIRLPRDVALATVRAAFEKYTGRDFSQEDATWSLNGSSFIPEFPIFNAHTTVFKLIYRARGGMMPAEVTSALERQNVVANAPPTGELKTSGKEEITEPVYTKSQFSDKQFMLLQSQVNSYVTLEHRFGYRTPTFASISQALLSDVAMPAMRSRDDSLVYQGGDYGLDMCSWHDLLWFGNDMAGLGVPAPALQYWAGNETLEDAGLMRDYYESAIAETGKLAFWDAGANLWSQMLSQNNQITNGASLLKGYTRIEGNLNSAARANGSAKVAELLLSAHSFMWESFGSEMQGRYWLAEDPIPNTIRRNFSVGINNEFVTCHWTQFVSLMNGTLLPVSPAMAAITAESVDRDWVPVFISNKSLVSPVGLFLYMNLFGWCGMPFPTLTGQEYIANTTGTQGNTDAYRTSACVSFGRKPPRIVLVLCNEGNAQAEITMNVNNVVANFGFTSPNNLFNPAAAFLTPTVPVGIDLDLEAYRDAANVLSWVVGSDVEWKQGLMLASMFTNATKPGVAFTTAVAGAGISFLDASAEAFQGVSGGTTLPITNNNRSSYMRSGHMCGLPPRVEAPVNDVMNGPGFTTNCFQVHALDTWTKFCRAMGYVKALDTNFVMRCISKLSDVLIVMTKINRLQNVAVDYTFQKLGIDEGIAYGANGLPQTQNMFRSIMNDSIRTTLDQLVTMGVCPRFIRTNGATWVAAGGVPANWVTQWAGQTFGAPPYSRICKFLVEGVNICETWLPSAYDWTLGKPEGAFVVVSNETVTWWPDDMQNQWEVGSIRGQALVAPFAPHPGDEIGLATNNPFSFDGLRYIVGSWPFNLIQSQLNANIATVTGWTFNFMGSTCRIPYGTRPIRWSANAVPVHIATLRNARNYIEGYMGGPPKTLMLSSPAIDTHDNLTIHNVANVSSLMEEMLNL